MLSHLIGADHLVFSRVTITPTNAEFVSILNPTNNPINLSNYYITDSVIDDNLYYNLPTGDNYWSESISSTTFDFMAKFPSISIAPNDSLILGFHTSDLFQSYYGYEPDIALMEEMLGVGGDDRTISCKSNPDCAFDLDLLHDNSEVLILFYWDGLSSTVKDVDYFLWGSTNHAINKTGIGEYADDTSEASQIFINGHQSDSTFIRIDLDEGQEFDDGNGNGIFGDDETSEDLINTWSVLKSPEFGCTALNALNYNPSATIDDGSCLTLNSVSEIVNNCSYESDEIIGCDGKYDLSSESASNCPLYDNQVTTKGMIVDYFDITPFNGPHSFTIEDDSGYRLDFVVWPTSSSFQDGFDISQHPELSKLRESPFERFEVQITGILGAYCDDDEQLDIYNEWQITVEHDYDISIEEEYNYDGYFIAEDRHSAKIEPAPYVIIPSLGETLDFSYSHPSNSRVLIRIYDLSGRFVTSIVDKYVENSGVWFNGINPSDNSNSPSSSWDGRDHLGQIVSPGTYLMHLETYNFSNGETHKDVAPIVVGVKQ